MAEMSKAERKAALKAAKARAKAEKKEAQNAGGKDKVVKTEDKPKTEDKKVEATAKVETPKTEAPKVDKPASKEEKKSAQKSSDKPKKQEKTPTIIPEEVDPVPTKSTAQRAVERATNLVGSIADAGIPIGSTESSIEGKAMLAFVMQQRYANNKELEKRYPELYTDINRSIDVVTLLALVDVRQDLFNRGEKGELELVVDANQIMPLQSMAEMLGIKLAPARALPSSNGTDQLKLNFSEAEVPEELSKDAGRPKEEEIPELDPEKLTTDEDIAKALAYLIKQDRNVAVNLVNTVEWYRKCRIMKEANADKKLQLDDKSTAEWIEEIFSRINPVSLLRGLGQAVYSYTSQSGSPCIGHALLYGHMSKAGWDEEQIASALKALIGENFRYKVKEFSKDGKEYKITEDKALQALIGNLGSDYVNKVIADMESSNEADKQVARKITTLIRANYFPKEVQPTKDQLRLKIGQIINLYRDPADRLAEYCQESLSSPVEGEYPAKEEKKAEEKLAEDEKKS